jgi:hypothetical protein
MPLITLAVSKKVEMGDMSQGAKKDGYTEYVLAN